MNPPFFPAINVATVHAVFGSSPVRVFPFGWTPDKPTKPYAIWQTTSGTPEAYINQVPDSDDWIVQVDVYVESEDPSYAGNLVMQGARVLRDELERVGYILNQFGPTRDPGTKDYRYTLIVAFVTGR